MNKNMNMEIELDSFVRLIRDGKITFQPRDNRSRPAWTAAEIEQWLASPASAGSINRNKRKKLRAKLLNLRKREVTK